MFVQTTYPPPRFRNYQDAMLWMECLRTNKPFPKSKWLYPFIKFGEVVIENHEYRDAPYEQGYRL